MRWKANDPPESAVTLTDADTTQHSLLVRHVLAQELANDVSAQTEAHHYQLRLRVRSLDVADHRSKLPCATWTGNVSVNNQYKAPLQDEELLSAQQVLAKVPLLLQNFT